MTARRDKMSNVISLMGHLGQDGARATLANAALGGLALGYLPRRK